MRGLLCLLAVALLAAVPAHCRQLKWRPVPVDRQCVDRFNAMVQSGLCSQGSTPALCCAALADMGYSCLDAIVAANVEDHRTYGQAMEITKSLRSQCTGAGTGSDAGSVGVDECLAGVADAFNGACISTSLSPCCVALEGLGTGCLNWFLEEVKDDAQAHDAFATLLQSCGMTSASPSTRAAPQDEAATQALTRLQQVGVHKLAAAPQAARSAAFQPDWHLDAPAAVEQRSAFSPDMLVKA